MLALAGTGSQLAAVYQGQMYQGGVYGAVISDYGSGYWIGKKAMAAAIADADREKFRFRYPQFSFNPKWL